MAHTYLQYLCTKYELFSYYTRIDIMASHSYLLHIPFRPTWKFVKTAHGPQDVIPPAESTTTD